MMRSVLAFCAGWLTMLASGQLTILLLTLGLFLLGPLLGGPDHVITVEHPGVTKLWIPLALGMSLIAGLAGGWVAATIGRRRGPVAALAIVVVLTSVISAVRAPAPSRAEPTQIEAPAAGAAPTGPLVMSAALPLLVLVGLALGSSFAGRRRWRRAP